MDIKLSYASIGFQESSSETYTYVDVIFNGKYLSNKNNNKIMKIYGINPFSNFINLKNNNKKFIGNKLVEMQQNNEIPIIINNGVALKYGLEIGNKINFSIENSYFRNSENILNSMLNSIIDTANGWGTYWCFE